MSTLIANCGISENGTTEGKPGDQIKGEYKIRNWYSKPWAVGLYYPNEKFNKELARQSSNAAKNDHIGYGQLGAGDANRMAMYRHLIKSDWETSKISVNCNADCSASTAANILAAAHKCGIKALQDINPAVTTRSLEAELTKHGFKKLTGKYLTDPNLGFPGLIYLTPGKHVTICVSGPGKMPGTKEKSSASAQKTSKTKSPSSKSSDSKKSNTEIAKEVIAGKWGSGALRQEKLHEAGYDYKAIQKIVNKLLKK